MLNIIICSREAWPHSSRNRPGSEEGTLMAWSVGWSSPSPPFPTPPSHPSRSSKSSFPFLQVILPSPPESSSPLLQSHPPLSSRVILPSAPESSSPLLRSHPPHSSGVILPTPPESSSPLLQSHPSHSSGVILPTPPGSSSPLLQSHPPLSSGVILPTPPESSFPLLQGHPSHSSRIRIGGSTLVSEASQAWPKMWQVHSSHCLCYLGCSSPALEHYLLVAGAPGGGLRPWSSHHLDSGPPPTLFNCGTFNTLLTDLYPSVPHLWWQCYLSYCVARRIKWVNKFHLKF